MCLWPEHSYHAVHIKIDTVWVPLYPLIQNTHTPNTTPFSEVRTAIMFYNDPILCKFVSNYQNYKYSQSKRWNWAIIPREDVLRTIPFHSDKGRSSRPRVSHGSLFIKAGLNKNEKYYSMWFSYLTLKLPTRLHSLHCLNLCLGNLITWIQAQKDRGYAGLGKEKNPLKNSQRIFVYQFLAGAWTNGISTSYRDPKGSKKAFSILKH